MSVRQKVSRRSVLTAKCSYCEVSSRRNIPTAKCPYDEVSVRRTVLRRSVLRRKISINYITMISSHIDPVSNFRFLNLTILVSPHILLAHRISMLSHSCPSFSFIPSVSFLQISVKAPLLQTSSFLSRFLHSRHCTTSIKVNLLFV